MRHPGPAARDGLVGRLPPPRDPAAARRATDALRILALDPTVGAVLTAEASPYRDLWLRTLERWLPEGRPVRKLPAGASEDRVLGGLDLPATLAAGRPVSARGLLADAHRGLLVVPRPEILPAGVQAGIVTALDTGECRVERDGVSARSPARFGILVLDESGGEDGPGEAGAWEALSDRAALRVGVPPRWRPPPGEAAPGPDARDLLPQVVAPDAVVRALCEAALELGIPSLRAPLQALRAARALAALDGRSRVSEEDAAAAARLALAPRARRAPAGDTPPEAESDEPPTPADGPEPDRDRPPSPPDRPPSPDAGGREDGAPEESDRSAGRMADRVLAAARVALPPALLPEEDRGDRAGRAGREEGRRAGGRRDGGHGRPVGTAEAGRVRGRGVDVLATLRAAAPWQRLRGRPPGEDRADRPVAVRASDLRVTVRERTRGSTTIFAVDASGSQALHRLAETKGAVELLLARGYARRDRVSLVAFRDRDAEVVLPPTRALARARRLLAGLPGGGGTPLAAGLEAARRVAARERRDGRSPGVVLLTDGRANVAADGSPGRSRAEEDALAAARRLRAGEVAGAVIDTSRRGSRFARRLAEASGAHYARLPVPDARSLGRLAREVTGEEPARAAR